MPNPIWALVGIILLAACTVGVVLVGRRNALVPILHNLIWSVAILLVGSDLIRYREASPVAWLVLYSGLLAFNVGSAIALRARVTARPPTTFRPTIPAALVNRPVFVAMLAIYAIAFGGYLVTIQLRFGLLTLLTDPTSIRGAAGESYLESVPLIARVGLYLGPLLLAICAFTPSMARPYPIVVRMLLVAGLAASMLMLLQRTNLFVAILLTAALLLSRGDLPLLSPGRIDRRLVRHGVVAVVAVVVVLVGSFQFLAAALGKDADQALGTGAVSEPLARSGMTSPFSYVTAGSVAFLALVDSTNYTPLQPRVQGTMQLGDNNPWMAGASTFTALLKVVPGMETPDTISPFVDTGILTNVYTWFEPFYRDFRLIGVAVGSLLLGWATSALYLRRFRSPTYYWVQSLVLSTVFLATFIPRYNSTLYLGMLAIIIGLGVLRRLRRPAMAPRTDALAASA